MASGARALLLLALAAQLGRHPAGAQRNVFQQDHPGRPTVDSVHVKTVGVACSSPYTLTQLTSPVFDGYLAALANVFTPTAPLLFNAQCAHVPGTVLRTNSHFHPAKQAEQACYAALSAAAWPHQAILMLKAVCEIACARWCQVPHGRAVRHRKLPLHSRQCAAEWHAGVAHQPAGAGVPMRRPPPHMLPICLTELMPPWRPCQPVRVRRVPAASHCLCLASIEQRCGGAAGHDCSPDRTV